VTAAQPDRSHDNFLRLPAVRRRTGLSTATIYRMMDTGKFPDRVHLSTNIVAWYESDVDRWVAAPTRWSEAA